MMLATLTSGRGWITLGITLSALFLSACGGSSSKAEDRRSPSVARKWNEVLLEAIRRDHARPTVHARNLFHSSAAMYDAWAAYSDEATPFLLGKTLNNYSCNLPFRVHSTNPHLAREEAISFAAYRLLQHRFKHSPRAVDTMALADDLMAELGYDTDHTSTDFTDRSPATLGNRVAECYINFGLADGANELHNYSNVAYQPVNPPLVLSRSGNPDVVDMNRWQPLAFDLSVDQSGNTIPRKVSSFLSAEWGQVAPFALQQSDLTVQERDGFSYWVYHDPGAPPTLNSADEDLFKWGHALVAIWSAHLDPADGVMIDISPASIGNNASYSPIFRDYAQFYNTTEGGDGSTGHPTNPVTGRPYEPQIVPRGDYARVLAEFWADGPESETPPGHWFVILNTISDHALLERRMGGVGDELGPLEWDVKAYFALGGAMHDAAITAWGIKGRYDYARPITAIRAMADLGQSSDPERASYHEDGIPLVPGFIDLVEPGDALASDGSDAYAHIGKIKLYAWRGPDFVDDPAIDNAGVGWILAENWWPYQRPSFVTPPFAGYISGHSTYSRAAAEVLTALTGSPYFPGGMSEFKVKANEFLVFERGPTVDITLQWATYQDAADQCSLSRIWGGIHPPADDIPGRRIGEVIGRNAFARATAYFSGLDS